MNSTWKNWVAPAAVALALTTHAYAQNAKDYSLEIDAKPLNEALKDFSEQTDIQVIYAQDAVDGAQTKGLKGHYKPRAALEALIGDPDLRVAEIDETTIALQRVSMVVQEGEAGSDSTPPETITEGNDIDEDERDVVIVTGTRIKNQLPTERVTVIDSAEIEARGVTDIEQLLRTIPNNFSSLEPTSQASDGGAGTLYANPTGGVANNNAAAAFNLRGAGTGATLILVNGRRRAGSANNRGAQTDIAGIPIEAIERVEVLQGGAAAIYGADAVGGVINIILKKDYSGATIKGRYGFSSSNADDYSVSGQFGHNWSTGNLLIGGRWEGQKAIDSSEFGYANSDFRDIGGDNWELASPFGRYEVLFGGGIFGRPEGVGSPMLSELIPEEDIVYASSIPLNRGPEIEGHSIFGSITQELGDFAELTIDGRFSERDTELIGATPTAQGLFFPGNATPFPSDFVFFGYTFEREAEAGIVSPNISITSTKNWDVGGTLSGEQLGWNWAGTVNFSKERSDFDRAGYDSAQIGFAFDSGALPVTLPDFTDPASAATLQSFFVDFGQDSRYNVSQNFFSEFYATRDVIELPGGPVGLVLGGEFRKEKYEDVNADVTAPTVIFTAAQRRVLSGFFEVAIPVFGKDYTVPGFHELTFSVAGRYEDYQDDFDKAVREGGMTIVAPASENRDQFSPKFGVSWRPVEDIRFTASYGKSFLTPNLTLLAQTSFTFSGIPVIDPDHPSGMPTVALITQTSRALAESGLENETSKNISAGVEITPSAVPGLTITADYFNIRYDNKLDSSISTDTILANPDIFGEFITRDAGGFLVALGLPSAINLNKEKRTGLEFAVNYDTGLGGGDLSIGADAFHSMKVERQLALTTELLDHSGLITAPLDWAGRAYVNWSNGELGAYVAVNYKDGYDFRAESNLMAFDGINTLVDSSTTVDVNLSYNVPASSGGVLSGTKFTVGAQNLFDADPPFYNGPTGVLGYNYDLRRRVVFMEVSKSF